MKTDLNLQDLRVDYGRDPLREEAINPNPLDQFRLWFQDASDAGIAEPNAMSLATSDSSGHIACRTVLLKGFDERGFVFLQTTGVAKPLTLPRIPVPHSFFRGSPSSAKSRSPGRSKKSPKKNHLPIS